jgi:hypothetical protein
MTMSRRERIDDAEEPIEQVAMPVPGRWSIELGQRSTPPG